MAQMFDEGDFHLEVAIWINDEILGAQPDRDLCPRTEGARGRVQGNRSNGALGLES